MEYKYIPKACQGKDAKFDGHVMLEGFEFDAKMAALEKLHEEGIDFMKMAEMKDQPFEVMKIMRRLVNETKDLWKSCEIKEKSTGVELKSREDVSKYNAAHKILTDVAMHCLGGGGLGN